MVNRDMIHRSSLTWLSLLVNITMEKIKHEDGCLGEIRCTPNKENVILRF